MHFSQVKILFNYNTLSHEIKSGFSGHACRVDRIYVSVKTQAKLTVSSCASRANQPLFLTEKRRNVLNSKLVYFNVWNSSQLAISDNLCMYGYLYKMCCTTDKQIAKWNLKIS